VKSRREGGREKGREGEREGGVSACVRACVRESEEPTGMYILIYLFMYAAERDIYVVMIAMI
jgi:hypothetical protein